MKHSVQLSFFWLLILLGTTSQAQVTTRQIAPGNNLEEFGAFGRQGTIPTRELPALDSKRLTDEDKLSGKNGRPLRVSVRQLVDVDLASSETKFIRNGYEVRQYQILVPGAAALSAKIDRLHLVEGARLFLYNAGQSMLVGPITNKQNLSNGVFNTGHVVGDRLILELQEPLALAGQSQVHLMGVNNFYDARGPFGGLQPAGACENNLICFPAYQLEADGVAAILVDFGTAQGLCTGSTVNDARQSFRSFFLTAFHCIDFDNDKVLDAGESSSTADWSFYFKYQSSTCATNTDDNVYVTFNGATFRSGGAASDFTLLELNAQAPQAENLSFLGWDRSSALASSVFGIHHPAGSLKKISFGGATSLVGVNYSSSGGYNVIGGTSFLQLSWNDGVTEGGSSGSALFNQDRRVIGQLLGGASFCTPASAQDDPDQYGRLFTSWTGGGTNSTRLSNWLDPTTISGNTTNSVVPTVSGPTAFTGAGAFSLNTLVSSIVSWSVSGGAGLLAATSGSGNTANLTATGNGTNLTITFQVNAGQSYPIVFTKTFNVSAAPVVANQPPVPPVVGPQSATVGVPFSFIVPAFTDPNGDALTYAATGLPANGLSFNVGTRAITGTPSTSGTVNVVVSATDPGSLSSSVSFAIVISPVSSTTTGPPSGSALTLLTPTYNCTTGAITFNTSGGDGTTITYTAVGVQRASATSNTGTVEPGLRADPKPLVIIAMQSGVTITQTFDFGAFCSGPGSGTGTPGGPLTLLTPTYNCATGAITFNTAGGDGTTITYTAVGVQRASATSNTGTVEPGLRADPKPLVIIAMQSGVTVTQTFDFGAFCSGPGSGTGTPGGPLSLLTPTYNCSTGAITFNTSGGDGTTITYTAVGVQRSSLTSNTGTVEPGLRGDPKPLVITATQGGVTTSLTFDFAAFCAGTSRVASTESGAGLSVRVLGNPTAGDVVSLEVRGAEGKSLSIQTMDVAGRLQSEQGVKQAGAVETVRARLGGSAGVYLIRVQAGAERQTVRVVKE